MAVRQVSGRREIASPKRIAPSDIAREGVWGEIFLSVSRAERTIDY
jgi:hypothetical protein